MTRYKEFLREHVLLACDYDALPYYELEAVETSVVYNGVVVTWYSNDTEPVAEIFYGNGDGVRFKPKDDGDLLLFPYDFGYAMWLHDNGYDKSENVLNIALDMYRDNEKVRIAFRHKQAGIMNADVFHKWFAKRLRKSIINKFCC